MFDSYRENTLRYYPERCINCRLFSQVCPHGVFAEGGERAELVQKTRCMECGACALNCPVQAIEVQSGVGCAWAMINAALRGKDMDSAECSCGGDAGSCCADRTETETYSCCGDSTAIRGKDTDGAECTCGVSEQGSCCGESTATSSCCADSAVKSTCCEEK